MVYLSKNGKQSGFTYLLLLLTIALLGVALTTTAEVWSKSNERNKLKELDWVGGQYVKAIESYYYFGGVNRVLPQNISDLALDGRSPYKVRHLRVLYVNPLSGKPDWLLLKSPGGGIIGVSVQINMADKAAVRQYIFNMEAITHPY